MISGMIEYVTYYHKGEYRKYFTGLLTEERVPYIVHLAEVAGLVGSVCDDAEVICAAWGHDLFENTTSTWDDVAHFFAPTIADIIASCSQVADKSKSRAERSLENAIHYKDGGFDAQLIKTADAISNCRGLATTAPHEFAELYVREKARMVRLFPVNRLTKTLETVLEQEARGLRQRGLS